MASVILRFSKQKGNPATKIEAHHERTKEEYKSNPDIDISKSQNNIHLIAPQMRYKVEIDKRIKESGCRVRKDSTRFVDTLITASPEFFKDMTHDKMVEYFQRAVDFIKSKIRPDMIFSAVIHLDEKTPHLHLCFVPLTEDKATIALVDSNLHREHLLPSEKAFAYKMKVEAMNRQGERTDLTSSQVGKRLNTYEVIAEESGESRNQIHRYIRLTNLLPELLKFVDDGQISFTPAVELSYLNDIEQQDLIQTIESEDCTPSLSQAVRMKKLSQQGRLDDDKINEIMAEEKANQKERIKIPTERVRKFFPKSFSNSQIEDAIIKMCEAQYRKKHAPER